MTKSLRYFLYFLIGVVIGCTAAKADSLAIALENDTAAFPRKDSEYTHGTEITYMRDKPFWVFDDYGFQIQQNMYGPKLIKTDDLQVGEHPYCGYLSFNFIGEHWIGESLSFQHKLGFGGVGPHSYAKESQKIIHGWLGCKDPKGWDKWQIKDEFIVQYEGWVNWNLKLIDESWFQMYGIPRAGLDVGGFKDMLAAGLDLKLGFNVPKNIGHGLILSAPSKMKKQSNDYSLFLLVGVEGRCVFHDTSIDGGFFRKDSPYTNQSETWVGELHFGGGFKIKRVDFEYLMVKRTNEFETEIRRPSYGKLLLKFSF